MTTQGLDGVFEHLRGFAGDQLVARAAGKLISRCELLTTEMNAIGFDGVKAEYDRRSAALQAEDVPRQELDALCRLEEKINAFVIMGQRKHEALFTLTALDFHVRGLSTEDVLEAMSEDTLAHRHQVLTRYHWVGCQKRAMDSGRSFNLPYMCEVGPATRRKGIDREFYVLLEFLPHLHERRGADYLLEAHQGNECPDFVVMGTAGRLGLEVTEANADFGAAKERKEQEAFLAALTAMFPDAPVGISVLERPRWAVLNANVTTVLSRLQECIVEMRAHDASRATMDLDIAELGLAMKLNAACPGQFEDWTATGYEYGCALEDAVASRAAVVIDKKVREASVPNIAPTHLVVYVNASPVGYPRRLLDGVYDLVRDGYRTKFEDVWFLCGRSAVSLSQDRTSSASA